MKILHPPGWSRPRGYSNGVAAQGTVVSIAGQIGWNAQQQFETDDLVAQVRQTLANVLAVLAEAGGDARHLVRMTWYLVDKREYLARAREIGAVYRELMGQNYPAMTAVQVGRRVAGGRSGSRQARDVDLSHRSPCPRTGP